MWSFEDETSWEFSCLRSENEALRAEVERLKAEVERLSNRLQDEINLNHELQNWEYD